MKTRATKKADTTLFVTVMLTVALGFVVFFSAALGLYARDGAEFTGVVASQTIGVVGGFLILIIASNIPYTFWKKYALYVFILAIIPMIIVLIPDIGVFHGGSRRWLMIGPASIQPGEFFKVAAVVFYAALLAKHRAKIKQWKLSIVPFAVVFGISSVLFIAQPKIGTLVVLAVALGAMLITAGARIQHVGALILAAVPVVLLVLLLLPYARDRVGSYLHPEAAEPLGDGYQIQQSLIAIGSGEWFGRGYGQSIQKFTFLPEPIGDSIFPVAAEELGFVGAALIVVLFLVFAYRGFVIAAQAPDSFARLLVLGLVILVLAQSFINIAAMLGIAPLTGLPLVFISHGGSAMLAALGSVGIILNVSKYRRS